MFGYIKPHVPNMRVCEYEYYRAIYCGLCRTQGKCTGCLSRLSLSYDFAFMAALRLALSPDCKTEIKMKRCGLNPLKKRNMMMPNEQLQFCACSAAMLAYHKCCDDIRDETGSKRVKAQMAKPFLLSMRKKAKREMPELDDLIGEKMSELSRLEHETHRSVDLYADTFGSMMSEILSYGLRGGEKLIAAAAGKGIGRYIYILDAYDDLYEDEKKGRFNPFLMLYEHVNFPLNGGRADNEPQSSAPDNKKSGSFRPAKSPLDTTLETALFNELANIAPAFDLIDYSHSRILSEIIGNILHEGADAVIKSVISKREKELSSQKCGKKCSGS